jgi:hypothetical protein
MTQVILAPAGTHYGDSVESPVPMERLARFLEPGDLARLREIYADRPVPTWGVTPGGRGTNVRKWQRIVPGDVVLMARAGQLIASGTVTHTAHNRALAISLWGTDANGDTWEYLYFLDEVREQAIPYAELNQAAGYAPGNVVQGFNVLSEARSAAILGALRLPLPPWTPVPSSREWSAGPSGRSPGHPTRCCACRGMTSLSRPDAPRRANQFPSLGSRQRLTGCDATARWRSTWPRSDTAVPSSVQP